MALAALNLDWCSNRMDGFREQARATWPQGQFLPRSQRKVYGS